MVLVGLLAACLGPGALAQSPSAAKPAPEFQPAGPVTIIVPYSPGGGTDAVGRLIAKALQGLWARA